MAEDNEAQQADNEAKPDRPQRRQLFVDKGGKGEKAFSDGPLSEDTKQKLNAGVDRDKPRGYGEQFDQAVDLLDAISPDAGPVTVAQLADAIDGVDEGSALGEAFRESMGAQTGADVVGHLEDHATDLLQTYATTLNMDHQARGGEGKHPLLPQIVGELGNDNIRPEIEAAQILAPHAFLEKSSPTSGGMLQTRLTSGAFTEETYNRLYDAMSPPKPK
ncbi:hypothetical protein ACFL2C_03875 [Patescibacteria group bacterium]